MKSKKPKNESMLEDTNLDIDTKAGDSITYQENMPSYFMLEIPAAMIWYSVMLTVLVAVAYFALRSQNFDPFYDTSVYLQVMVGTFCICLFFVLIALLRVFKSSGEYMIKYSVLDDHIIVSNIQTGICIFNFRISEIACVESVYSMSCYADSKCFADVKRKQRPMSSHYLFHPFLFRPFAYCMKRCLLISSPNDELKQRIPVGYSKDMRLKLKNVFSYYGVIVK